MSAGISAKNQAGADRNHERDAEDAYVDADEGDARQLRESATSTTCEPLRGSTRRRAGRRRRRRSASSTLSVEQLPDQPAACRANRQCARRSPSGGRSLARAAASRRWRTRSGARGRRRRAAPAARLACRRPARRAAAQVRPCAGVFVRETARSAASPMIASSARACSNDTPGLRRRDDVHRMLRARGVRSELVER